MSLNRKWQRRWEDLKDALGAAGMLLLAVLILGLLGLLFLWPEEGAM
ncbi:MAG TPA: hypothetical protein VHZ24_01485 [Pirellulales bacterium]|jgi:hypothetical protein|nr:hypothetical protein [Pirellulales bacterium]